MIFNWRHQSLLQMYLYTSTTYSKSFTIWIIKFCNNKKKIIYVCDELDFLKPLATFCVAILISSETKWNVNKKKGMLMSLEVQFLCWNAYIYVFICAKKRKEIYQNTFIFHGRQCILYNLTYCIFTSRQIAMV